MNEEYQSIYHISYGQNELKTGDYSILPIDEFNISEEILYSIKSVSFRVTTCEEEKMLSIETNINRDQTIIANQDFRDICFTFNLNKCGDEEKLLVLKNNNYIFYKTNTILLNKAQFIIKYLETGLNFENINFKHPTIIELLIRKGNQNMSFENIKQQYQFYTSSNDEESLKVFPQNSNTSFNYNLPQRLNLIEKWYLKLHHISFSNKIFNVQEKTHWIETLEYEYVINKDKRGNDVKIEKPGTRKSSKKFMKAGHYPTQLIFLEVFNTLLLSQKIKCLKDVDSNKVYLKRSLKEVSKFKTKKMKLNHNLAVCLGFKDKYDSTKESYIINISEIEMNSFFPAKFNMNISYCQPQEIILNCSIIKPSIFGFKKSKIVELFHLKKEDLEFSNKNEYIYIQTDKSLPRILDVHSFDQIHFSLESVNGEMILIKSNFPCMLHFSLNQYKL